jgi:hypothetical protein
MITASGTLRTKEFLGNRLTLNCPDESEISAAYDALPARGVIEITCSLWKLPSIIQTLDTSGFIGIFIHPQNHLTRGLRIIACKGKEGACYDTGRSALYRGGALAALDDDRHLLFGKVRVCEKTANVYLLPVYKEAVSVTKGIPELIARLKTDPALFDCDTFESDAQRLYASVSLSQVSEELSSAILYPGPFRSLIMADGAIVRRGIPTRASKTTANRLIKSDGGILLEGDLAEGAKEAENFVRAYRERGTMCLLDAPMIDIRSNLSSISDLTALDETPAEMKQRLLNLIESDSEYFIITGSDVRDMDGCCPSDGVTAANRLVEAGVLQAARLDDKRPDACPVNIYAFAGEIKPSKAQPDFRIKHEFRHRIKEHISKQNKSSQDFWIKALRWSLLLFVAASLVKLFMPDLNKGADSTIASSNMNLVEELDLPFQNGLLVLQFHRTQRCAFCSDMEKHAKETLDTYFSNALQEGRIAFRQLNMELPKYQALRKKYSLFTSTLVLIELNQGRESRRKIVTDAWHLTDKRQEFIEMLRSELADFQKDLR